MLVRELIAELSEYDGGDEVCLGLSTGDGRTLMTLGVDSVERGWESGLLSAPLMIAIEPYQCSATARATRIWGGDPNAL